MDIQEFKQLLIDEAKELEAYVIEKRRHFHMNPETGFEEVETSAHIEEELRKIGYDIQKTAITGIIANLDSGKEGKTIALRADIDALNVTEDNDKPYCSKIPGKMHACGHDAHTAMLLGAAKIIYKNKDKLTGKVKLVFQPAEEGGGGAKKIVDEGHIDDVYQIFGIHVWQEGQSGTIATRKGPFLASADQFIIEIKGKGGHAACPHQTFDPTAVLVDIYNAIQKIVTREIDPLEKAVISIPMVEGSDAHNIIPTIAKMQGTFRTFNNDVRNHILKRMKEIVEGYSLAWRCVGKIEFEIGGIYYPPTINHAESVDNLIEVLKPLDEVKEADLTMGGEDFAFYLNKTKGAFIALGLYNEEKGIIHPHHHPKFDIDEEILWKGTAVYALLAFYNLFIK
ncbi:MAG: amidohydrolase [Candidatus Heimdallarchaeota archaeon]|nr:amidohydrolase [Candidatus Heimdallarchaeota archaeon]MCK4878292.1 amidohydrolase [Candidatus Heimdallarchaeota archaeon]